MILVTGASGTVGREVVSALAAAGAPVRAASRKGGAGPAGTESVAMDFGNPESIRRGLDGVDKVFLALGGVPNQAELESNVVRAARQAGVKHLVKLSVLGADSEGFSFAKLHRGIERAIESSGVPYTLLRPNGFMQNFVTFMGATIKGEGAIYQPAGMARISHVDVRDIAAVAAAALTSSGHEGKAYAITGPEALSYDDAAAMLTEALGKTVKYVDVPEAGYREGLLKWGIPADAADALIDLNRYYKTGNMAVVTTTVKDVTGHAPMSFSRFARDHAAALR
ncbi:MAG: SDR family oxidoreductase [Acidobacteriota bacterium]